MHALTLVEPPTPTPTPTVAARIADLHPAHPYAGKTERQLLDELHRLAGEIGQYRSIVDHDPEHSEAVMAPVFLTAVEALHAEASRILGLD